MGQKNVCSVPFSRFARFLQPSRFKRKGMAHFFSARVAVSVRSDARSKRKRAKRCIAASISRNLHWVRARVRVGCPENFPLPRPCPPRSFFGRSSGQGSPWAAAGQREWCSPMPPTPERKPMGKDRSNENFWPCLPPQTITPSHANPHTHILCGSSFENGRFGAKYVHTVTFASKATIFMSFLFQATSP